MKPSRTRFSNDSASSKREAVAPEDASGVEGDLLERDLGVGEPGRNRPLEVLSAERGGSTKPESTRVSGTIPRAKVCHVDARVAGLCVCDDFLELVDGVAELSGM